MKKTAFLLPLMFLTFLSVRAQIGIDAGVNFAGVTGSSSINSHTRTGFMAGIYFTGSPKKVMGYRMELNYSRQGYNYGSGTMSGGTDLSYLSMSSMLNINITKYVAVMAGMRIGYLLNAHNSDSLYGVQIPEQYSSIMNIYNRLDYGLTGGVEIHPYKGLAVGARYNLSLSNLYKMPTSDSSTSIGLGSLNLKNNLVQLYIGYRF